MSDENFTFETSNANNINTCPQCPISNILACRGNKPSFRKRHPIIFLLFLLAIFCAGAILSKIIMSENELSDDSIALINVQGPIISAGPTLAWIREVEKNPLIKGALLRVDSPGGGAAASQEIYAALARLASKMPLAVSMGATAASGGLMISMAGQKIFANPSTITGSIGVRMDIPQLQGLMNKIGIGQETLVTAPFKDAASYMRPLTPEDRAYLKSVIENMHDQFVDIVAKGRHMSKEKAASLANGKIYTGQEALALGLIDAIGGQYEAHFWLAEKTGVQFNRKLFIKREKSNPLLKTLLALGKICGFNLSNLEESGITLVTQPAFLYQWP